MYWIAENLAWDDACAYNYIFLDQASEKEKKSARNTLRKIHEILLLNLYTLHMQGYERSSYRLCESIHRELLSSPECLEEYGKKIGKEVYRVEYPFSLAPSHDLVDTDIIHYATLGHFDQYENTFCPVTVFTCDNAKQLHDRISVQLTVLRFLCNRVIGSEMKIIPGVIYVFNPDSGKITNKIDVASISESDEVAITLHHKN